MPEQVAYQSKFTSKGVCSRTRDDCCCFGPLSYPLIGATHDASPATANAVGSMRPVPRWGLLDGYSFQSILHTVVADPLDGGDIDAQGRSNAPVCPASMAVRGAP